MLMQELLRLNEGKVKDIIFDLIQQAIDNTSVQNTTYELAISKIANYIRANDKHQVATVLPPSQLKIFIKDNFSKQDHAARLNLNEAEEEDSEWPKVIAKADEYRVEVDEDEQVSLIDGKGIVKVIMPLVIWKQLVR